MLGAFEKRYLNGKKNLINEDSICKPNRDLFKKFLDDLEYKLKRTNTIRSLDEANYRTLYGYVVKFRNVNSWFKNKPWKSLTKAEIKKVYDDLEDGKLKRSNGIPYENLAASYYSKILKSKPFEMAGKLDITREVMQYHTKKKKDVRFVNEEDFKKILVNTYKPIHQLLIWLAWDIGENINSLLELKKSDFHKQTNPDTKEQEYRVNLRKEILKRARRARSELTNYNETVVLLDQILPQFKDNDLIFNFGYGTAKKILDRAVERARVTCIPNGEKATWKDLRSGMTCNLLKIGWSMDELNARLGHKPSSDEIDKYVNFLAIDRNKPKQKVYQHNLAKIEAELLEAKEQRKLTTRRMESLETEIKEMKKAFEFIKKANEKLLKN